MERIRKTILQATITGITTCTGCTDMCTYYTTGDTYYVKYGCTKDNIIPDLDAIYNIKIGLISVGKNLGFFNAYTEPVESGDGYEEEEDEIEENIL